MIAGRLRTTLRVWRPVKAEDEYGQKTGTWEEMPRIRAERVRFSGRSRMETAEVFASYDAAYNVRSRHDVAEGWRVQECPHAPVMRVDNVIPWHGKGFKQLLCHKENT